jgi:hypothetical protein
MTIPVLNGSNVVLRPAREADAQARFALGSDPEIMEMFGAGRETRPVTSNL